MRFVKYFNTAREKKSVSLRDGSTLTIMGRKESAPVLKSLAASASVQRLVARGILEVRRVEPKSSPPPISKAVAPAVKGAAKLGRSVAKSSSSGIVREGSTAAKVSGSIGKEARTAVRVVVPEGAEIKAEPSASANEPTTRGMDTPGEKEEVPTSGGGSNRRSTSKRAKKKKKKTTTRKRTPRKSKTKAGAATSSAKT